MHNVPDVVVIGAGAIGASTAYHLARSGRSVVVLEKEDAPARHQSGRNSGVIHAGYNAKPGTLKARYCVEGNRRLHRFCAEHGVAVRPGGILVVAKTEAERATLRELLRRSAANGAQATLVDQAGIADLEPEASGIEALHAPEGSSFDAVGYVNALVREAKAAGARFQFGARVRRIREPAPGASDRRVHLATTRGESAARVVVACVGLQADRLAGPLAREFRIVPFRGYYAEVRAPQRHLVRSHVYRAPDPAWPFLGVHLSRRFDDQVIVGPGAMLAFGREAYEFHRWNLRDLASTVTWGGFLRMAAKPRFLSLAAAELGKSLSLKRIWREAHDLVPGLRPKDLVRSFAGNRAQLVDRHGDFVDDLVVRETASVIHVLNAVSPGLTTSLPFGEDIARRAVKLL